MFANKPFGSTVSSELHLADSVKYECSSLLHWTEVPQIPWAPSPTMKRKQLGAVLVDIYLGMTPDRYDS